MGGSSGEKEASGENRSTLTLLRFIDPWPVKAAKFPRFGLKRMWKREIFSGISWNDPAHRGPLGGYTEFNLGALYWF
jgi:hypothetical protein